MNAGGRIRGPKGLDVGRTTLHEVKGKRLLFREQGGHVQEQERGGRRRDGVPAKCRRLWGGPRGHCSGWPPDFSVQCAELVHVQRRVDLRKGTRDADAHISVGAGQRGDGIHAIGGPGSKGGPENMISPQCGEGLSVSRGCRPGGGLSQFSLHLERQ